MKPPLKNKQIKIPPAHAQATSLRRRPPANAPPSSAASAACGRKRRRLVAWRAGSSLGPEGGSVGEKPMGFGRKMVG